MTAIEQNNYFDEEVYEVLTYYRAAAWSNAESEAPMPITQCSSESLRYGAGSKSSVNRNCRRVRQIRSRSRTTQRS